MGTSSRTTRRTIHRPCRSARLVAAALTLVTPLTLAAGCSRGDIATLDADGVKNAILNENDFPDPDGWTSTGISTETAGAPVAPTALTSAKGMPAACRKAFTTWAQADPQRKAGVNNNFTKFDADNLNDALIIQLAVRSFDKPPTARERLREVAQACGGTMTLTPSAAGTSAGTTTAPGNLVTIGPNPVNVADADGLRLVMPLDGKPAMLVTVVAQRGQNLAQVVGIGPADQDVAGVVQRVLDAQVEKLEKTAD